MPKLVKTKYIDALRPKLAELRAQKMSDAEIVAALNAPTLVKAADEKADPPTEAVYGPSWARGIGLGELLPEFIAQVDGYAGLDETGVADECAKLLLEACLTRHLAVEEKTVADAKAEVAKTSETTRWQKTAGIVAAYTGVDAKRAEALATGLVEQAAAKKLAAEAEAEVRS